MNCRVDIPEDIRCYQDTLSYASSKVDYSRREGIYMQPSNMNLNTEARTAGYNNEILVSDGTLGLGRNHTVQSMLQHQRVIWHLLCMLPCQRLPRTLASKEKRVALVLTLLVPSEYGTLFVNVGHETR